jgi:hypothetical protein
MKVLVLSTYPVDDASRRLRIDPLANALAIDGDVKVDTLLSRRAFKAKNKPIGRFYSLAVLACGLIRRLVIIATSKPDVLIVHREAFPFFTPWVERWAVRRSRVSLVDIDDAIFTSPTHGRDWRRFLRNPSGALGFSDIFDLITVGNDAVAEKLAEPSKIISYPTCPEERYSRQLRESTKTMVWIGSASTLINLSTVLTQTLDVCEKYGYDLVILGGDNVFTLPKHPRLIAQRWSEEREEAVLRRAALGLMPLQNTVWDQGKSGYKAILYTVAGVPSLISPVGLNKRLGDAFPNTIQLASESWLTSMESCLERIDSLAPATEIQVAREYYDVSQYISKITKALTRPKL